MCARMETKVMRREVEVIRHKERALAAPGLTNSRKPSVHHM